MPPPFFSRTTTAGALDTSSTIGVPSTDMPYQLIPAMTNPNPPDYSVGDINPNDRSSVHNVPDDHEMQEFSTSGGLTMSSQGMTFKSIASDKST